MAKGLKKTVKNPRALKTQDGKKIVNIRCGKVFYSDGTEEFYDEDKHGKFTKLRK